MSELAGKELAIKVAEKSNRGWFEWLKKHGSNNEKVISDYLHTKAAEILFSEGMAGRIDAHLYKKFRGRDPSAAYEIQLWWATITPGNILNVWLEINKTFAKAKS